MYTMDGSINTGYGPTTAGDRLTTGDGLTSNGNGSMMTADVPKTRFTCEVEYCNASFCQKRSLVKHIQTKHYYLQRKGNTTLSKQICPKCGSSFANVKSLSGHIHYVHGPGAACLKCGNPSAVQNLSRNRPNTCMKESCTYVIHAAKYSNGDLFCAFIPRHI
jgi:uncharacterized C2H2 Zn-finger protein